MLPRKKKKRNYNIGQNYLQQKIGKKLTIRLKEIHIERRWKMRCIKWVRMKENDICICEKRWHIVMKSAGWKLREKKDWKREERKKGRKATIFTMYKIKKTRFFKGKNSRRMSGWYTWSRRNLERNRRFINWDNKPISSRKTCYCLWVLLYFVI